MTESVLISKATVLALVALSTLAGCSHDDDFDYCKNHYQVHAEHVDSIGHLLADLSAEGVLTVRLNLPASALDMGLVAANDPVLLTELLQSPDKVYRLETDQPCAAATVEVNEVSDGVEIEYESQCGAGNRVKQINIELFDLIAGLEEVEVQVSTPATNKHFAISRLCERAIFRLKPPAKAITE